MNKILHPFRKEINDQEKYIPANWSSEYVASRMILAAHTLKDLNVGKIYPSGYSSCFPEYKQDWNELLKEAITPEEQEHFNEMAKSRNSSKIVSGHDIMLMEESLYWPIKYLYKREILASSVNLWVASDTLGVPKKVYAKKKKMTEYYFKKYAMRGFEIISSGLEFDKVTVR